MKRNSLLKYIISKNKTCYKNKLFLKWIIILFSKHNMFNTLWKIHSKRFKIQMSRTY